MSADKSLRRGAGSVPSPGGDAIAPAVVALTDAERDRLAREVLGGASPSPLMVRAVERIVADRLAAAGVVSDAAAEALERVLAECLYAEDHARQVVDDEVLVPVGVIRHAVRAVSGVAASKAEPFPAVLRSEAQRRHVVESGAEVYVYNAIHRDQMRRLADQIERWGRGEFAVAASKADADEAGKS